MKKARHRVSEFPMTHAVAVSTLAMGLNLFTGTSTVLAFAFAAYAAPLIGVLAILGAALSLAGLQWRGECLNGMALEKVGLALTATAWALYVCFLAAATPTFSILTGAGIATASIVRACVVHRRSRQHAGLVREAVRQAREAPADEGG